MGHSLPFVITYRKVQFIYMHAARPQLSIMKCVAVLLTHHSTES